MPTIINNTHDQNNPVAHITVYRASQRGWHVFPAEATVYLRNRLSFNVIIESDDAGWVATATVNGATYTGSGRTQIEATKSVAGLVALAQNLNA